MLKKTLSFQPDSRGKWTPNYEGPCAMTLVTIDKHPMPSNSSDIVVILYYCRHEEWSSGGSGYTIVLCLFHALLSG